MFWESSVEENSENAMDASFSHMQGNSPSAGLGRLGTLNISSSADGALLELASEPISFYSDDEETQEAPHWRLNEQLSLPDEGPALRLQIIKKPKGFQRRLQDATNSNEITPSSGFRVFNSLSSSCSMESSMEDEEYIDFFEMQSLEEQLLQDQHSENEAVLGFPSNLNTLISGQIKSALTLTPEMRRPSVRRCLSLTDNASPDNSRQQQQKNNGSTGCTTPFSSRLAAIENNQDVSPFSAFCFKRPDPPSMSNSPIQTKRCRGDDKENIMCTTTSTSNTTKDPSSSISTNSRVALRKSMSMNDAEIMTALARSDSKGEPDLIGDFSKPYVLPLMDGRHRDLKTITSDTVAQLLNGAFDEVIANYVIVDCRYPYEYEGGHIRGAKNLYTQEQIVEEFLTKQKTEQQQAATAAAGTKRNIIIFHCEFSSERGPRLSRFLRNHDRERNTNSYPTLDYPEIYLLHNGYKEFYETHGDLCVPNSYRPMLEPAYGDAYRHFRAKSKSWNGDGLGGGTTRHKKSRSRLLL